MDRSDVRGHTGSGGGVILGTTQRTTETETDLMPDSEVFISYQHERHPAAQHLAEILRLNGYSVWFDTSLIRGRDFGLQIDARIRAAKALVVLWCKRSVMSSWVHEEVDLAQELGILIPLKIEPCNLITGTRRSDYVNLSDWDASVRSPLLDPLFDALEMKVGRPPTPNTNGLRDYEDKWRRFGERSLRDLVVSKPRPAVGNPLSFSQSSAALNPVEGQSQSAAARPPARTRPALIVNPNGRGTHRTIQAAINDAEDGMQVLVTPGVYQEHLRISKGVHLQGLRTANAQPRVAGTDEAALTVMSGDPLITNISFCKTATIKKNSVNSSAFIKDGSPRFDSCDFYVVGKRGSYNGEIGCRIDGTASPIISNCKLGPIVNGYCLIISGHATPIIKGCHILQSPYGFHISSAANPLICDNVIEDIELRGIEIIGSTEKMTQARGLIERNKIRRTQGHPIWIQGLAFALIRDNLIEDIGNSAICVFGEASGVIEGNEIRRAGNRAKCFSVIAVGHDADPIIRNNRLMDARHLAIHLERGAPRAKVYGNSLDGSPVGPAS